MIKHRRQNDRMPLAQFAELRFSVLITLDKYFLFMKCISSTSKKLSTNKITVCSDAYIVKSSLNLFPSQRNLSGMIKLLKYVFANSNNQIEISKYKKL